MRLLGSADPVMSELTVAAIEAMGAQYPELLSDKSRILSVSVSEEESFLQTLISGTAIFDIASAALAASDNSVLPAADAFKLHDTYGFPFDLTLEMAREEGLEVDEAGFRRLMKEQKDRAKADSRAKKSGHTDVTQYRAIADKSGKSEFCGYTQISTESIITGILNDGLASQSAVAGDAIEVILNRTPFYAEGGGQLADGGKITLANGAEIEIDDVQTPVPGVFVHRGRVIKGGVEVGDHVLAHIDVERRNAISRAHTATHMVHKAFREVLGETATQAGSENAPGRFRFDFPSTGAVSDSAINEVESRVNTLLLANLEVTAETMTQAQAKNIGAMALFGEKYGDQVRVVSVGDWARELCGGTHVSRSGELGIVKLLGESSIGSGVRRVEALVGTDAYRFLAREHVLLNSLTSLIKGARVEELPERISDLLLKIRDIEKELSGVRSAAAFAQVGEIAKTSSIINGVATTTAVLNEGISGDDLRKIALEIRDKSPVSVVALISVNDAKAVLVVAASAGALALGVKAGALVKIGSAILGGGGGGKDDFAQGGGTELLKVDDALAAITVALKS